MSFTSDYRAALKKLKKEEESKQALHNKATGKKTSSGSGSESSFMATYRAERDRLLEEQEEKESIQSKMTVGKLTSKDKDEEEKRTWFDKGALRDGYQFGDISKVILGTVADVGENLGAGIMGMGEKAVDALAYIAPYAYLGSIANSGSMITPEQMQMHNEIVDVSKKELGDFIKKDLYNEEEIARKIVSSTVEKVPGVNVRNSVLGEKSDSLMQSGGQLLGTMGLQAVGVPWWLTYGTTSFGEESENALNQGASYEEAGASAAISAAAEVLTEKLSGGIKFGGKAVDDVLTKQIARSISNKYLRTGLKLGLDAAGEGMEEWITADIQKFGQWLTYQDETELKELLFSEEAMDEKIEAFIGGAALGGGISTVNAVRSGAKGIDYATEMTENEKKVVDKVYQDRVAEAEKNGKVTEKQKSKIYDDVLRDFEKGYISTETIEEVLGDKDYQNYKETVEYEDALFNEFEELGKKQNATLAEQSRYNELQRQVADIKKYSTREALKNRLSESVYQKAQGDRLVESYNERARRGQTFEADLSKYDQKQQQTIQNAINSGTLNNTNRTHELVDFIAKVSADKGVLFDFTNNEKIKGTQFAVEGKIVNGYVTDSGITLNVESPKYLESTVGHEITHVLEGTEFYDTLKTTIFEYAKSKGEYDSRMADLTRMYESIDGADIEAELTADLVGDYIFSDKDFVNKLSTENRNVFQKIYDEIKYLCKVATAGSKEARELEKVKKVFEDAYRASGKQTDTKYSLSDSDGKDLTREQQEYFKDSKMRDENGNLKVMYHGSQDAGFHVFDAKMSDDDTSFFFVDRNDVAASYSGTTETYEAKTIRSAEDMNNFLAEIGYDQYEAVEKNGKFELLEDGEHVTTKDTAQEIYEEFCWYEGVGEGDANYKVYLNLKNPLEVDAQGRNWNNISREFSQEVYDRYQSLTAEEKAALTDIADWGEYSIFKDEMLAAAKHEGNEILFNAYEKLGGANANLYDAFSIASDNFSEESLREFAVKQMNTREYAQKAKAEGYDGVIFKNIVDNGGYSNGSEGASTVAIAFDSNQIKSVANEKPTGDKDIRFSLSESVEETKDLVALHNLTGEKLLKSLNLGGLPMPSVAIARAKDGHNEFGEISLVLPRETIDPQTSRRNKLYSGDAWTPTYPKVEFKPSEKVLKAARSKVNALVPYEVQDVLGHVGLDSDNARDSLDRYNGNMVEAFKQNDTMKYAYLKDSGSDISLPMKEEDLVRYGDVSNSAVRYFSGKLVNGLQTVEMYQNMGARDLLEDKALCEAVADALNFDVLRTMEPGSEEYIAYEKDPVFRADEVAFRDIDRLLSGCRKLFTKGIQRTVDRRAAKELVRDAVDQSAYESWLAEIFDGVVEKEGIRNNKDYFTPSGNRRSFEALHYEHNLENVIKAMREKGEKGIGFGGGNIFGAATTEFSSIEEMKKSGDRLQQMSEEEYQEIKDGFTNRFFDLASSLPNDKKSFIATDDAATTLTEAVAKYKTRSGIANYLRRELKGWATYSDQVVDDLIALVNDIRNMPTGYFEAKPQRAVGFDEVAVFIIPYDADVKLKQELLNRGYAIAEYDPKVEGDRTKVLNQFEEYKFSLSNVGDKPYGNHGTLGKDIAYVDPNAVAEVAPAAENSTQQQKTQLTEDNSTDAPVAEKTTAAVLYNKRDGKNGWGDVYATAQEALNDAVQSANTDLWDAFNEEVGNAPQNTAMPRGSTPITNALIAVQEDVRQETITPIQGAQLLSDAYTQGGVNALKQMVNPRNGNLYPKYLEKAKQYESVAPVADVSEMFPDEPTPQTELDGLIQEKESLESRMLEMSASGDFSELESVNERWIEVRSRVAELENEISESESGRVNSLDDADIPPEMEVPYSEPNKRTYSNPFADRDWYEVGKNRSVKAFMTENPEFKPFFQEEAAAMLYDLADTQKAERWYNDALHYESGGELGFGGQKRFTSQDIAQMLDEWGLTYAQIEEGLTAIVEDNDKVNQAAAKRIEFKLHERLMNGYKDFHTGKMVEPNQAYLDMLYERQVNAQAQEAFDSFMATADQYAPEDIAPVAEKKPLAAATPDTMDAPIYQSKDPNTLRGQTTMFAPPKPSPSVATVLTEEVAKEKEKSGIGKKIVSQLVDKGMVFENLSLETGNHELQAKYNSALPSNTEAKAQYFMEHGANGVKPLKDIRREVKKAGKEEQFFNYLYHVHNIDRMTLEDRFDNTPNKTVFGETVTADVSRRKARQMEIANPMFRDWANDVYAYNKHLRNLLVEGNVISQETADLWEKMYPHYVPIRRDGDKGLNVNVPLDSNKTGVNNPVKRATGGSGDILPLFETMAMRTEQTYRAIARNAFGIELKNTLGTTLDGEQSAASVDEMIDTIEAQEEKLLKPGTMNSNPTFTVFENGERVEFEITEDMYEALKPAGKILGHRIKALNKMGEFRRNLLTVWNPVFALYRNPIKDIQDVAVNSQHPMKTYLNVPNAIFQMATNGKWATEYHQNGGKSNTYFDSQSNKFKEDSIFKKTIGIPVKAVETAGEFIEEIPRLAEYIASRSEGRSVERSMLDAARVTTNFAAGGDFTKFLNTHGFTFLNASVQGASQHVRNFREAKQQGLKGYVKVLAKYTVAGLPGILLNSLMWDDDEDYEELSDYVKQNYYVVAKTEDGKFVRLPKGRTAAVMQNAMEQMQNLVTGNDEVDFGTFFELFMNNIAPNNPIENNILAPIGQVMKNEAWYGGDLVPSRLQSLPAAEQFDESTDSISKWLGEATNTSPYKWNYLLDQYSGGAGDVFLPMLTPEAESGDNSIIGNFLAPWKKEITTDKVLNNKNPGNFYDLKDELEVQSNSRNATEEDTMRTMYMDSVSWEMSDLYKRKREVQNSDLPDDEKYEEVRNIQEQINALAENALNNYKHVSVNGLYSEAGDKRYNKDAESGKWYEIREKNSDGSDNWYYQKEQEVTKALGISYGEYWNNREEYNYAYDNPEKYTFSKAVGGYQSFRSYTSDLWDIKADKDENGKSINGSRKKKVIDYCDNMDADYGEKIILFKSEYPADDTYNYDIIEYLNGREDISYKEMETILKYLGFEVDSEGNISWD